MDEKTKKTLREIVETYDNADLTEEYDCCGCSKPWQLYEHLLDEVRVLLGDIPMDGATGVIGPDFWDAAIKRSEAEEAARVRASEKGKQQAPDIIARAGEIEAQAGWGHVGWLGEEGLR